MKLLKKFAVLAISLTSLLLALCLASCEEEETPPAHEHTFGEWQTVTEPTCALEGKKEQKCSCGEVNEETLAKLTTHTLSSGDCTACGYKCPHSTVTAGVCAECGAENATYTISVKDAVGNPKSAFFVYIFRGDEQMGINFTDDTGVAKFTLPKSSYTFTVTATAGEFEYDKSACVLSVDKLDAEVTLYSAFSGKTEIYGNFESDEQQYGYVISSGKQYSVAYTEGQSIYFVFSAEKTGIYRISFISDSDVLLGYYGSPHYVLQNDITKEESRENGYTVLIDIAPANLAGDDREASKYCLGVSGFTASGSGVLLVERIADHVMTPSDLPFYPYVGYTTPEFYRPEEADLPGFALVDLDLTDTELKIVKSEADGLYHYMTEDGPVVLIKLDIATKYLESISKMCETQQFACYVYNEDGSFKEKINYQVMLLEYIKACESDDGGIGAYVLDDHLVKMIKDIGTAWGWYDLDKNTNIFYEDAPSIVPENAWMFALCYIEVAPAE